MDYDSLRSTIKRKILSDPQKELQSIITHLEEENRQLQIELIDIQGFKAERLHRHRTTIESQLQRLKLLKVYHSINKIIRKIIRKLNHCIIFLFFLQKCLFIDTIQTSQITRMQSTPMLPLSSRLVPLPLEFELSPIIRQENMNQETKLQYKKDKLTPDSFNMSSSMERTGGENNINALPYIEETSISSGFNNITGNNCIELSTWIGGKYNISISIKIYFQKHT